jgi:membrane peptidoglycan carboxypeptidase
MTMPDARFVYVGDGSESHFGIPARDLTDDDLATLTDEQKATVKASRLYQSPPKAKDVPKQDAKDAPTA